jgi:hypothetical protein
MNKIGDFTATYLGLASDADPSEIAVITRLKEALART